MKQKFLVAITAVAFSLLTACDNGTSSGDVVATSLNDSRDGQIYNIVKIGDQVWMAENLKYEIPVAAGEEPKSFCYSDSEINCGIYGRLYTWDNAGISRIQRNGISCLTQWVANILREKN